MKTLGCLVVLGVMMTACGGGSDPQIVDDAGHPAPDGGPTDDAQPGPSNAPTVSAVTISEPSGYADNQVRQGLGNVVLSITGTHLDGVDTAILYGDAGAKTACTIDAVHATDAKVHCTIGHGEKIGLRKLTVGSDKGGKGWTSFEDAVEITHIFADASVAADAASKLGTSKKPFRSITEALAVADSGDTVEIRKGTYGTETGETFPKLDGHNVKDGVSILGDSDDRPTVHGAGLAFGFEGGGSLSNVRIREFETAVGAVMGEVHVVGVSIDATAAHDSPLVSVAKDAKLSFASINPTKAPETTSLNCYIDGAGFAKYGISSSGTVTVDGCTIRGATDAGLVSLGGSATLAKVRVEGNGKLGSSPTGNLLASGGDLTIRDGYVADGFAYGILTSDKSALTVQSTRVVNNGKGTGSTAKNAAIDIASTGKVTIGHSDGSSLDTIVENNANGGVRVAGTGTNVTIDGLTLSPNGGHTAELAVGDGAKIKVRHTNITSGGAGAVAVEGAPLSLDFGTASASGNTFASSSSGPMLLDHRPDLDAATGVEWLVCTGDMPAKHEFTGPKDSDSTSPISYKITGKNQRITFCK